MSCFWFHFYLIYFGNDTSISVTFSFNLSCVMLVPNPYKSRVHRERNPYDTVLTSASLKDGGVALELIGELSSDLTSLERNVENLFSWVDSHPILASKLVRGLLPSTDSYVVDVNVDVSHTLKILLTEKLGFKAISIAHSLSPHIAFLGMKDQRDRYLCMKQYKYCHLILMTEVGQYNALKGYLKKNFGKEDPNPKSVMLPFAKHVCVKLFFGYNHDYTIATGRTPKDDEFLRMLTEKVDDFLFTKIQASRGDKKRKLRANRKAALSMTLDYPLLSRAELYNLQQTLLQELAEQVVVTDKVADEMADEMINETKDDVLGADIPGADKDDVGADKDDPPPKDDNDEEDEDGEDDNGEDEDDNGEDEDGEDDNGEEDRDDEGDDPSFVPEEPGEDEDDNDSFSLLEKSSKEKSSKEKKASEKSSKESLKEPALLEPQKKSKTKATPLLKDEVFPTNFRLRTASVAGDIVLARLNKAGVPLDYQLKTGEILRREFGGPATIPTDDEPMETQKVKLLGRGMAGDAPYVVACRYGWSKWFRDLYFEQVKEQAFIRDPKSNGGKSVLSCEFVPEDDSCSIFPMMTLGAGYGLQSIRATKFTRIVLAMNSELANLFIDQTNVLLGEARVMLGYSDRIAPSRDSKEDNGEDNNKDNSEDSIDDDHFARMPELVDNSEDDTEDSEDDSEDISNSSSGGDIPNTGRVSDTCCANAELKVELRKILNKTVHSPVPSHARRFLNREAVPAKNLDPSLLFRIPRKYANLGITKGGPGKFAKFALHNDGSNGICRRQCDTEHYCSANRDCLPTRCDFVVVTSIFGQGTTTQGVVWKNEDGKKLGSIHTENRCVHIQFVGCNDLGIKHCIGQDNLPGKLQRQMQKVTPGFRFSFTCRMVYDTQVDCEASQEALRRDKLGDDHDITELKTYDYHSPVTDPFTNREAEPEKVHRATQKAQKVPWTEKKIEKFKNSVTAPKWERITRKELTENISGIRLMEEIVGTSHMSKQRLVTDCRLALRAMELEYLIHNVGTTSQPLWTLDGVPVRPGEVLPPPKIPLRLSSQRNEIINSIASNFLLLLEMYKNDPDSTYAHNKWANDAMALWRSAIAVGDDPTEESLNDLRQQFEDLPPLRICARGGSTQPSGTHAPLATTHGPGDSHVTAGHHQDLINDHTNKTLVNCLHDNRALAIGMRCGSFDGPGTSRATTNIEDSEFNVTGYYRFKSVRSMKLTEEQVEARFAAYPGYLDDELNCYNTNFLSEGFYEFEAVHGPTFDQYMLLFRRQARGGQYKTLNVTSDDKTALRVPKSELPKRKFAGKYVHDDIVEWYCAAANTDAFLDSIPSPDDPSRSQRYIVELEETMPVLLGVSGSAAARSNNESCTKKLVRDGKTITVPVPLHGDIARRMSMPQRLSPLPHWNSDLDPGVAFTGNSIDRLCQLRSDEADFRPDTDHPGTYQLPDLSDQGNVRVIADSLFMAMVMRLTGNFYVLEGFPEFMKTYHKDIKEKDLPLPTRDTAPYFSEFLLASETEMSTFISTQHKQNLPDFVNEKEDLIAFLHTCCTHQLGFDRVTDFLSNCGTGNAKITRKLLFDRLKGVISDCGDQMSNKKLNFVVSKIIADVETVFPEFAGEVTLDTVFHGHGADNGEQCIVFPDGGSMKGRDKFIRIHKGWQELLLSLPEEGRKAFGWKTKIVGDELILVSIKTGRKYSYVDTEHGLCKLWLIARASHTSRNTAKEVKNQSKNHCFPLRGSCKWAENCQVALNVVLQAYMQVRDNVDYLVPFPAHYDFPSLFSDKRRNARVAP